MAVLQSLLCVAVITVLISLPGPADGWNRIMFDLFEKPGCTGKKFKSVREADYAKGKGNGCYLTDGAYQSVYFYTFKGMYYTGGGCATAASKTDPGGCNGFQGDRYISGIADH